METLLTRLLAIGIIAAVSSQLRAQDTTSVVVSGTRFTYPLIMRWISEFSKENPYARIILVPRTQKDPDEAEGIVFGHELHPNEKRSGWKYQAFARYAILPVAHQKSAFARSFQETGLAEWEIRKLYFREDWQRTPDEKEAQTQLPPHTFYTRQQQGCAPLALADHYQEPRGLLRGKEVIGEDKHLLSAVLRDTSGVTYAFSGLLYDLTSRKIIPGLTVLAPYRLKKKEAAEWTTQVANADRLLEHIEAHPEKFAIAQLYWGFPEQGAPPVLYEFMDWIQKKGADYLKEYGYLPPPPHVLQAGN